MRDIRGDLKDRAEVLEREIKAAQVRFDELMVRLKQEHDGRINELKSELDAVKLLIGLELRLLGNGGPHLNGVPQVNGASHAKPQPQAEAPRPQAPSQAPSQAPAQNQPPRPSQQEVALRKAGRMNWKISRPSATFPSLT